MAFDPTIPKEGTEIDAVELRDQLNALKALIDQRPTVDEMNAAILAQTSGPSDMVAIPEIVFSDPPTSGQLRSLQTKVEELMMALRRQWP